MYQWILPSLKDILINTQSMVTAACESAKAQAQWRVSLAAAEQLLLNTLSETNSEETQGLVLTAPAPVFSQPELIQGLHAVTFSAKPFNPLALPFALSSQEISSEKENPNQESILPLLAGDPLANEQFCLVFTNKFRLILVLAEDSSGEKQFLFSFDAEVVEQAWRSLGARVILNNPDFFAQLEEIVQKYNPKVLNPQILMQFSQFLLANLPGTETGTYIAANHKINKQTDQVEPSNNTSNCLDVELLQAFAHEVRTPLSTIRTITQLLLKKQDLPANVIKRLRIIDRECTEQIDRMELLFRAAELETLPVDKPANTQLTTMCLEQVLKQSIPRWQQAANRRNLTLDVLLPQQVPAVVSNPNMLDRVLTGLMENFTRSLPAGSHIQVQVIPAGNQLKLQLLPQLQQQEHSNNSEPLFTPPIRKAIGELLTFQPETGVVSLNLAATKHLFQAIGGKLIVRQRPHQAEVLTIFLPLQGVENSDAYLGKMKNWHHKNPKSHKLSNKVGER
ncbi:MAG: HAMP domain-containing sensor histidine kinase [Mastigocoleus sp. MO_167.B18]|nr:HAMP domain-containing sensor histidine kinase [Mastigocoleus sp. MO_167.B18]